MILVVYCLPVCSFVVLCVLSPVVSCVGWVTLNVSQVTLNPVYIGGLPCLLFCSAFNVLLTPYHSTFYLTTAHLSLLPIRRTPITRVKHPHATFECPTIPHYPLSALQVMSIEPTPRVVPVGVPVPVHTHIRFGRATHLGSHVSALPCDKSNPFW